MLPQGRFRELLVAGAGERERILKTLFHTQVYSRIQDQLKSRAAAIRHAAEALETQRRTLLEQAEAADLERGQGPADLRSAGGLDLLVDDGYTGKLRGVETLSGGQGFQTALGLALGLAQVVQAYARGVRLDTIFIDEGFGSLDPDALELAIDTLIDLQQGGRLVGIVSHVPELRERIDERLEVSPGRGGSRARIVLP